MILSLETSFFRPSTQKFLSSSPLPGKRNSQPSTAMSDDTYDDLSGSYDPFYYEDPVSERAMVFHHMAKLTDEVKDPEVKNLCMTVLKKLNVSIRAPSGELRSISKTAQ